jgi:hypothetical protein
MSNSDKTRSDYGLPAKTLACGTVAALLAFASLASPAAARWGNENDRHNERTERNEDRQEWHRGHYYRTPPVIYERYYNAPTYYAPPVVYGPAYDSGFGLNINIR